MSRVLRNHGAGLERIQFRDLDSIPDTSQDVFEVVEYVRKEEPPKASQEKPSPSPQKSEDTSQDTQKTKGKAAKKADSTESQPQPGTQQPPQEPEIDVESIKAEAYAQGEAAGRKKGRKEVMDQLDSTIKAFSAAATELEGLRSSVYTRQSDDLVRLALLVAEQVIKTELSLHPEVIVNIVSSALKSALEADEYHIRVNPEDVEAVQENKPLFLASVNGLRHITVEGDGQVTRGGCVVESNFGQVDAQLETKLTEVKSHLEKSLHAQ